jgi:tRNA G10  N-methylase Trm11
VGIDAKLSIKDVLGTKSNFVYLGLGDIFDVNVSLCNGFAEKLLEESVEKSILCMHGTFDKFEKFDAIVTDPPYNMNEKVLEFGDNSTDTDSSINNNTRCLLIIADRYLNDGGRLVFLFPTRHHKLVEPKPTIIHEILLREDLSSRLQVIYTFRQEFSATFSRWLVVIEKKEKNLPC